MNAIFSKNKYTKMYFRIVEYYKVHIVEKDYEIHHIIPKSLGGDDTNVNLIKLPKKAHFVCHKLLPKMVNDTEHKVKMMMALWYMSNNGKHTARGYEAIRKQLAMTFSEYMKGPRNPNYGNKWTDEQKATLSEKLKGRKGHRHTDETKLKIANANRRRTLGDETKKKLGAKNIGNTYCKDKPKSEEHKKKLSIARQDKTIFKWNHDIHGLVECTRTELIQMFPEQNLNSSELGKVVRGNYTHHKGWMITNLL